MTRSLTMAVRAARRGADYRTTFASPEGRRVLRDLYQFCMATTPTADPNEAVFTMGMQRVFRRIAAMIALDEEALMALANATEEDDDDR